MAYYSAPSSAAGEPSPALMVPDHEQTNQYSTFPNPTKPQQTDASARVRRRINLAAVFIALLVPWVLFTAVFATQCFELHYKQPVVACLILLLCLSGVMAIGGYAWAIYWKKGGLDQEPTWFIFLFLSSLLAWVSGFLVGKAIFASNMQPFYNLQTLNTYPSVDPEHIRGGQLMDAGRIIFVDEARVDFSKSMVFRNVDLYCVAPITVGDAGEAFVELENYDFWAVGTNCCSGAPADFHCGEAHNPNAHAGLRLMEDEQRPYFRLAVQQAEAAYNIKANHPIFLRFMQDPISEANDYMDEGARSFVLGVFSYAAFQAFLVVSAVFVFSKIGGGGL